MQITFLCKVVDNYGDIGVIWRICRGIQNYISKNDTINLIIDDLFSFKRINSDVDVRKSYQKILNVNIYKWNDFDFCYKEFSGINNTRLEVILEMFQCGRPDWLEKILFDEELNHIVQIIMVDYLTAEKYAEDFHKLMSLTRRGCVKKVNFMPGFTKKTGGLALNEIWGNLSERNPFGDILFFCYERNWDITSKSIKDYFEKKNDSNLKLLIAQGQGKDSFIKSAKKCNLPYIELDYLNQNEWDIMMKNCSFMFVRGEETMSRACLSGIPFIWHAYPQSDDYHLVKVNALLERMRNHFTNEHFEIIKNAWLYINSSESDHCQNEYVDSIGHMLDCQDDLVYGFRDFALSLINNGDLCLNLVNFIKEKIDSYT